MIAKFTTSITFLVLCQIGGIAVANQKGAPTEKYLIIHADDVGVSHGTNMASIDLLRSGAITSLSIMAPCPWVFEAANMLKDCKDCDVGVHMTLNSEWSGYRWSAITATNRVQSLLDSFGTLLSTPVKTFAQAKDDEVALEIESQIIRLKQLGLNLSHLDTHMGTVTLKHEWLSAYVEAAERHGLLPMLTKWNQELESYFKDRGLPFEELKAFLLAKERSGYPMLDRLITDVGGRDSYDDRYQAYEAAIRGLQPGITQIITHLSNPGPELDAMTSQLKREKRRIWDVEILKDSRFQALIKREGVRLISWQDLES